MPPRLQWCGTYYATLKDHRKRPFSFSWSVCAGFSQGPDTALKFKCTLTTTFLQLQGILLELLTIVGGLNHCHMSLNEKIKNETITQIKCWGLAQNVHQVFPLHVFSNTAGTHLSRNNVKYRQRDNGGLDCIQPAIPLTNIWINSPHCRVTLTKCVFCDCVSIKKNTLKGTLRTILFTIDCRRNRFQQKSSLLTA